MTTQFNPPPAWPEPPHDGWTPPAGFSPPSSWGPVPAGWRLWVPRRRPDDPGAPGGPPAPLLDSEDVPASGARPRERVDTYPISVINPGMWSDNHLEDEDYGFPPPKAVTDRPRLRLGATIAVTALGLVLAALTAVLFVLLVDFAIEDLPGMLPEGTAQLMTSPLRAGTAPALPDAG